MRIKTVKVTNNKNVLVQIPGSVVKQWGLTDKDSVEVHISDNQKELILKPRKGYVTVSTRKSTEE